MDLDIKLLADVAVLRLDDVARIDTGARVRLLDVFGRRVIRRGEDRLFAEDADTRVCEHRLVASRAGHLLVAAYGLAPTAPLDEIRFVNVAGRSQEPRPLLDRQRPEQTAIAHDLLEHFGDGSQPLCVTR